MEISRKKRGGGRERGHQGKIKQYREISNWESIWWFQHGPNIGWHFEFLVPCGCRDIIANNLLESWVAILFKQCPFFRSIFLRWAPWPNLSTLIESRCAQAEPGTVMSKALMFMVLQLWVLRWVLQDIHAAFHLHAPSWRSSTLAR